MHDAQTVWHIVFIGVFSMIVIINTMDETQVEQEAIKYPDKLFVSV